MATAKKINRKALLASTTLEEYREAGGDSDMSSENQRIRSKLVEREVVQCVSMLVYHFCQHQEALTGSEYSYDDLLEICQQQDWENSVREHDGFVSAGPGEIIVKPAGVEQEFDTWQEAAEALGIDDPQTNEAYEHWVVSDWFAARLKERGEMTGELFGLTIWGRCTTGQGIAMDSVIGSIAAEMQILEGQKNDWSK